MFGPIGVTELLLIFGVALLIFGPRKLPEIGRTVGRALGEFKKATNDLRNTIEEEVRTDDRMRTVPPPPPRPVANAIARETAAPAEPVPPAPEA